MTTSSPPTLRTIEAAELEAILSAHRDWLGSNGVTGQRAELDGACLSSVDLAGRDLRRASFRGSDLSRSRLIGANLSEAVLVDTNLAHALMREANLQGADLDDARFRDADLRDADLRDVRGLTCGQFGGADVSGAKLPDSIAQFDGLANVEESSKTASSLFTSTLLICSYTWLTIMGTRDAQLLNNAAPPASRLPILGTDIPLIEFYLVAPLLLFCFYLYFHMNMVRLWEELANLPAVFPDGRGLDSKAYPWMLNSLVCLHVDRLKKQRPARTLWVARFTALLAWGIVPFTLVLLWARYLTAHDWRVTGTQILQIAVSAGAGIAFYRLAVRTLHGSPPQKFQRSHMLTDARSLGPIVAIAVAGCLFAGSLGAIEGINLRLVEREISKPTESLLPQVVRNWVPRSLSRVGIRSFASLDDCELSTKPSNWSGKADDLILVKGADLSGRDLRFADAYSAFFVNAFLKGTDLRGADLREADFRNADLRKADLRGANLRSANFTNADLRMAKLSDTVLTETIFENANLRGADLQAAKLPRAKLAGADLTGADLAGTDLTDVEVSNTTLGPEILAAIRRGASPNSPAPGPH